MSFLFRFLAFAALIVLTAPCARAQKQEQTMLDRINNPDLTLKFDPAEKQFSSRGALNNKTAAIKPFAFSKSANVREGFRTAKFNGAKGFSTKGYVGNKDASIGKRSFAAGNRPYGTRDFTVRDALEANKTLEVNPYVSQKEPFVARGKSQGTIDTLMADKNLTIDQVRELLNKNR